MLYLYYEQIVVESVSTDSISFTDPNLVNLVAEVSTKVYHNFKRLKTICDILK